jgi:hypothetical protein
MGPRLASSAGLVRPDDCTPMLLQRESRAAHVPPTKVDGSSFSAIHGPYAMILMNSVCCYTHE